MNSIPDQLTIPPMPEKECKLIYASLARDIADKASEQKMENQRKEIAEVIDKASRTGEYSVYYDHYIPTEIAEELKSYGYEIEHRVTNYDSYWKISWEGEKKNEESK